jgi:lysozyme
MIDMQKMVDELKRDEGFRGCVYKCTAGKMTVGYGHNLESNAIPEGIAEKLLNSDIGDCLAACERFDWFYGLSDARQRVIVNMVFNIGANGVERFQKMIAAIEEESYEEAAYQMVNSRWYNQVGARAERLCEMMREG